MKHDRITEVWVNGRRIRGQVAVDALSALLAAELATVDPSSTRADVLRSDLARMRAEVAERWER